LLKGFSFTELIFSEEKSLVRWKKFELKKTFCKKVEKMDKVQKHSCMIMLALELLPIAISDMTRNLH